MSSDSSKKKLPPQRLLHELAMQDIKEVLAKNFHIVENKILYRSAQPERKEFIELERKGCKSILNLRCKHSDLAKINGLKLREYRLQTHIVTKDDIIQALSVIRDAEVPILVHSCAGTDRTGIIVAAYRIVFQNWSVDDALAEYNDVLYGKHRHIYRHLSRIIRRIDWDEIKTVIGEPQWRSNEVQEALAE